MISGPPFGPLFERTPCAPRRPRLGTPSDVHHIIEAPPSGVFVKFTLPVRLLEYEMKLGESHHGAYSYVPEDNLNYPLRVISARR